MNTQHYLKIFAFFLFVTCSCKPYQYYGMKRVINQSNKLPTDGVYVANKPGFSTVNIIVLYKNGALFYGTPNTTSFKDFSGIDSTFLKKYGGVFTGIYNIQQDSITIERNIITDAFWGKTKTTKHGKIINDTTFIADMYGDRIDTFRFVRHGPKPDSSLFDKYKHIPKLKQ